MITGGVFSGGPSALSLQLSFVPGGTPLTIKLIGAHIEAQVTAANCMSGRLGGGITITDLNGSVIPGLASQLDKQVTDHHCADMPIPTTCTSADQSLLGFLDKMPKDGHITANEISDNTNLSFLFNSDVRLKDASGVEQPSVSIAIGFGCIKGVYTASSEH